ncbi:hypothetical protein [Pseudescherichia sp. L3]|uniref:hypothetical protein n=1 Tax=Pseudescherichia sp. L3 TaxID=2970817 RepID=UPI0021503E25|nr:hypothetical protein [Pseudescherichia sp. L3]MCR4458603.1 hypothetical protein [Pseudescherichia sp. L3]
MLFDWKELISPVVTVTAVWLGARLALSNDIRKKTLELETVRLERLVLECDSCLRNLNLYCMNVGKLLHDLSKGYEKSITLASVTQGLVKSAGVGIRIDFEAVKAFQITIELHRPADFKEWKRLILPLILHLDHVVASPSWATEECTEQLSRMSWRPEKVKNYNEELAALAVPLPSYRQQLIERIAGDYRALMHSASPNLWVMARKTWRAVLHFVRYSPSTPGSNTP